MLLTTLAPSLRLIHIVIFVSAILHNNNSAIFPEEAYGKFRIDVTNYTKCQGSKRVSAVDVNASWVKNEDGTDDIIMNAYVKKPVGPLGIRMKVSKCTNGVYKSTLEYRIKNICTHFLGREALEYMPKVDSKCYLHPGPVHYEMIDYNKLMHVYFGERFFYGRFLIHADYSSDREGIVCNDLYVHISQDK